MDDKDTFYTFGYRGGFISTCHNRTKRVEEVTVLRFEGTGLGHAKASTQPR